MQCFEFTTTAFRDTEEVRQTNVNGIEGRDLTAWVLGALSQDGWDADKIIDEDYGWGAWAKKDDVTYWIAGSLDPAEAVERADNEEALAADRAPDGAAMHGVLRVERHRRLWDRLRGRNRQTEDDAVARRVIMLFQADERFQEVRRIA